MLSFWPFLFLSGFFSPAYRSCHSSRAKRGKQYCRLARRVYSFIASQWGDMFNFTCGHCVSSIYWLLFLVFPEPAGAVSDRPWASCMQRAYCCYQCLLCLVPLRPILHAEAAFNYTRSQEIIILTTDNVLSKGQRTSCGSLGVKISFFMLLICNFV